jgi:vacuolar-type H+-ATPase subunit H
MSPPSRKEEQPVNSTVAAAINEVLEAQRATRQGMRECDRQAEGILRDARERARRIRERAEQRIQRWYSTSDQRASECVRTLDDQEQLLRQDPAEALGLAPEWLAMVRCLADELIGGDR